MDDKEWLPAAQALPYGSKRKIQHCGRDASMNISHTSKGYLAYCFRCDEKGFKAHGILSIPDLLQRKQVLSEIKFQDIKLPKDFTTDIPPDQAIWLLRAGVPLAIAKEYKFGYSDYWKRVVLPVYEQDGSLRGFTSRSTIGEKPKYVARLPDGPTLFHSRPELRLPSSREDTTIVIVEDILSCVRVGRIKNTKALLGTSSSESSVTAIYNALPKQGIGYNVILWLDGDRAGRNASSNLFRSLKLRGVNVSVRSTTKDPKLYSNRQIKEILEQC